METFDFRDTLIPFSLLRICNHFKQMRPGEVVEIICSDRAIEKDIKRILHGRTCEIRIGRPPAATDGVYCIRMRKIG